MNDQTVANGQLKAVKRKLESAISSRATLEKDFSHQSTLLIQFISKLSQVCKGIDLELDNRLAKLRVLFSKSAPITDIEQDISAISQLLQQHSLKNDQSIIQMHNQFHQAGKTLQQINGLPDSLRRSLRSLIKESEQSKEALIQYVDIFSQLLTFYDGALKAKSNEPSGGLLNSPAALLKPANKNEVLPGQVNQKIIEQFTLILNGLTLSETHNKQLTSIKKKIITGISNDKLMDSFLETFNVIIEDFQEERKTAESFLSTLSKTLATVKEAVKSTLSTSKSGQDQQNLLNAQLNKQIIEVTSTVEKATSLAEIKVDINQKLQLIAGTLEEKTSFEYENQKDLESQLNTMTQKVNLLEKQSYSFEKRLQEQQLKSMQDALTKLGNRAAFDEYFAKEMVRYHHQPFDLAIVVMDLDDFKRINDTYGHTAGDKTLQVIANTLTKKLDKKVFIGRYGGEEFVLIYSGIKQEQLMKELNLLNKHIARLPFKFKNNKVSITMSIGVSHITEDDNIHIAFERADKALYQAKGQGKNQVVYL